MQIDDFDYNIWLKHQNTHESRKEWRIFVSKAICQMLKKGETRFIIFLLSFPTQFDEMLHMESWTESF